MIYRWRNLGQAWKIPVIGKDRAYLIALPAGGTGRGMPPWVGRDKFGRQRARKVS